ncbi:hypothetical protein WEH80_26790 [Actinomycetes bacterium KLBMP 9759]
MLHPNDGSLTFARSVARRGVRVDALVTDEFQYVLASRWVDGTVMPDIASASSAWFDEVSLRAEQEPVVLVCGSDAAVEWVVRHRHRLPAHVRCFEGPGSGHLQLMDKFRLYKLAAEIGVKTPSMHVVASRQQLSMITDSLEYPCVLKASLGHLGKKVLGYGTVVAHSTADLMQHADPLLRSNVEFLLTELVPGPESALEGAVAIRCQDGTYPMEYGRRKVRQWPLDYGVGSLTESADVPEMIAINRRILEHARFHGLASCEAKRHSVTGELHLIEVNVRMPGSFGLADACGADGSWRLYATLAGLPLEAAPSQKHGRKVMLPTKDLAASLQRIRRRESSALSILRSLRGVRDVGALHWRDPSPALSLGLQMVRKGYRFMRRRA